MSSLEVVKHSRKVFGIFRNPNLKLRNKIGEVLIEIAIIVFAITLSLFLERQREHAADSKLEQEFLEGLRIDLTADLGELKTAAAKWLSMKQAANYFLKPGHQTRQAPDSTNVYAYKLFHNVYFFPNHNRFEALKSTGKLAVIENKGLRNNIIDLYQTKIPDLEQQINFFNNFMNTQVKDYLIHNFKRDKDNQIILDASFFSNEQLKNILALYSDIDDILKRSNAAIHASEGILQDLKRENK